MPIVADIIELHTNCSSKVLRLSKIEKFADGSGYCCELVVQSEAFGYRGPFYFDDSFVLAAISAMKSMISGVPGKAIIKGQWENDAIQFEMNQLGHIAVSGLLLENGGATQSLKFLFMTDQTTIDPFVRDLILIHDA